MQFTNHDLKSMIIPLFLEQCLVMLVGMADTVIISHVGEAAISGVSLVNQFNTIFIYLFTALAAGGAVVISQYIGLADHKKAGKAASQLLSFSVLFSVVLMILILLGNRWILRTLFGSVDDAVMDACITYLRISAYSYPAMAIYNAGAAIYRSLGKTKTTMYLSVLSNIINVIGNLIGVFVLRAGVAGVAYPSLIARVFGAVAITWLCFSKTSTVRYSAKDLVQYDRKMMTSILHVAVPNGIENGFFQLVKVALSSIVALFGTYQIAANGVAQSIWSVSSLAGMSMGPVYITVIGRCMGTHDTDAADYYFKKLNRITVAFSTFWNLLILALTPLLLQMYVLEPETKTLTIWIVAIHNIFNAFIFPFFGSLSNGLRAAGDVRFTMTVSILSTIFGRLLLSYVLGVTLGMGVVGITWAMVADWAIRGGIFLARQKSGKWKEFRVIEQ